MLTDDPARMSAYSSLYPGVDHLPTRLPRLDAYGHAWCYCGVRNGGAVAGDGQCDQCRASYKPGHPCAHPARYGHGSVVWECARCNQSMAVHLDGHSPIPHRVCEPCKALAREPQGTAVRLFEPAPNQMPGQLSL